MPLAYETTPLIPYLTKFHAPKVCFKMLFFTPKSLTNIYDANDNQRVGEDIKKFKPSQCNGENAKWYTDFGT